jgi:mediator of RNA polymerase II transcription subunit 5
VRRIPIISHLQHLQQAHDIPPPDNLLPLLTANPVLLTVIAQYVPPTTLSQALLSETILASDDPSSRAEDPQGCLTRYGEAVILNEVIEAMFQVGLAGLVTCTDSH